MKGKAVIPRELANRDVDEALAHYVNEAPVDVALGFIDALEQAYALIGQQPGIGSPRWGHELGLPGLRAWPLTRYPYLVFYEDLPDHVAVWRVLQAQRDVPAGMLAVGLQG